MGLSGFPTGSAVIDATARADATTAIADAATAQADATSALSRGRRTASVTVTHADLTANATTQAINLSPVIPAGAYFEGVMFVTAPLFSGGGVVSLQLDLGWAAEPHAIVDGAVPGIDLVAGVASSVSDMGTGNGDVADPRELGGKTLQALFTCDGAHTVDQLTAGSVVIQVWYFVP